MTRSELAIETAFPQVSIALRRGDTSFEPRVDLSARRASMLHAAVADVCAQADITPRRIDAVLVDVGPGSYTGLRVGLALVKSLHALTGVDVRRVFSTDQIARCATPLVPPGEFAVCLDARRSQWFYARYRTDPAHGFVRLSEPSCLTVDALREAARGASHVVTTHEETPLDLPTVRVEAPHARGLLELSSLAESDTDPMPVYLMPPI